MKQEKDRSYFENVLRKTDVFVDGVGCGKLGLKPLELTKKNAKLIVTEVDCKEPFAALNVMKAICAGLYLRETTGSGQVGRKTVTMTVNIYSRCSPPLTPKYTRNHFVTMQRVFPKETFSFFSLYWVGK